MITKKEILEAHLARHPRKSNANYRHEEDSALALARASRFLDLHEIRYELDKTWPFHLIAYTLKRKVSIFCSGFDRFVDIQALCNSGSIDRRYEEKRFLTHLGAVNYVLRRFK